MLNQEYIRQIIALGLSEDIGDGDKTTQAIIPSETQARAKMTAKAEGIIAGLPVVKQVFQTVDVKIVFNSTVTDGDFVKKGDIIANLSGAALSLLTAERLALNFLQRMSGIATKTARYVQAIAGTKAKIFDTRKTVPGHRLLDKYSVKIGGEDNHRLGLYDMIMIKDNHIDVAGSIDEAVKRVRRIYNRELKIEVETRDINEVKQAFELSVDRIMLDNMPLDMMRMAVALVDGQIPLEASGGVSFETVRAIAETGVDYISVGALTHSVSALDISLTIEL